MSTIASPIASPMMLRLSTAAELMTPNLLTFDKQMPIQKAQALLKLHSLDGAPLVDSAGRLAGIVTAAACDAWEEFSLRSAPQGFAPSNLGWTAVSEIASPLIRSVRHSVPARDVIQSLVEHRARRIYVVNDDDELVGVVSMSDVLWHLVNDGMLGRFNCEAAGNPC